MDETNIFIAGVIVSLLFLTGVIFTIKEFRQMTKDGGQDLRRSNKIDVDTE